MSILIMGCGISKKDKIGDEEPVTITYLAQTRGYYYKVELSNSEIVVYKDAFLKKVLTKKIDTKEWKQFCQIANNMNLTKMKDFKAPSEGSSSDRAAIASLTVHFRTKSYTSNTFDHGAPPKQLKPLIDKILALSETVQ